jgi:hypothetical protein
MRVGGGRMFRALITILICAFASGAKCRTIRGGQAMYLLGSGEAAVDSWTRNHGQPGQATPTGGAKAIRQSD